MGSSDWQHAESPFASTSHTKDFLISARPLHLLCVRSGNRRILFPLGRISGCSPASLGTQLQFPTPYVMVGKEDPPAPLPITHTLCSHLGKRSQTSQMWTTRLAVSKISLSAQDPGLWSPSQPCTSSAPIRQGVKGTILPHFFLFKNYLMIFICSFLLDQSKGGWRRGPISGPLLPSSALSSCSLQLSVRHINNFGM